MVVEEKLKDNIKRKIKCKLRLKLRNRLRIILPLIPMSSELNKKIFELTLAVYRVTDIFPREEVLKRQIREKANEILSSVCEYDRKTGENNARFLLSKIQAIRTYLGVARFSNMVKAVNTAVLDREYEFFANYFERELARISEEVP